MPDGLLPPLFGKAPPLSCGRAGCDADATHHVIWTADVDNGLCCDQHAGEARRRWTFWAIHPYELTCSTPGAVFVDPDNRCAMPEPTRTRERHFAEQEQP